MYGKLSLRYMKQGAAISILLIIGVGSMALTNFLKLHFGIGLSFIAIGTFLITIMNAYLWYCPLVIFLYEYPDMRGSYEGTLKYSYRDDKGQEKVGELKALREISQSGSGLFIRSTVYKANGEVSSMSTADNVELVKEDENTIKLTFHYRNEGSPEQNFPPHDGTEILRFTNKNGQKTLSGNYYTNRLPFQTNGKISLTRKP